MAMRGMGIANLHLANSKESNLPFQRQESGMKLTHEFGKQTPRGFLQGSHQPNTLQGTNHFLSNFPSQSIVLLHCVLLKVLPASFCDPCDITAKSSRLW